MSNPYLYKYFYLIILSSFMLYCSGNQSQIDPDNSLPSENSLMSEIEKLNSIIDRHADQMKAIDRKLASYKIMIEEQNTNVKNFQDKLEDDINNTMSKIKDEPDEKSMTNVLMRLEKKIKILEDRAFYTDSLYFEMVNDLVMVENKITSLLSSYKEMSNLKNMGRMDKTPKITNEEYTAKYIEALSLYQNGEWTKSLDQFTFLINIDANHDLADNCQYWIGEVYYALKDYKRSILEFENVFTFSGTNKADDAQFKLGLSYINIGELDRAREEFKNLLEYYPNSEYYKKTKQYLKQY